MNNKIFLKLFHRNIKKKLSIPFNDKTHEIITTTDVRLKRSEMVLEIIRYMKDKNLDIQSLSNEIGVNQKDLNKFLRGNIDYNTNYFIITKYFENIKKQN